MRHTSFTLFLLFSCMGPAIAADAPPAGVFADAGFKITLVGGASATKQDGPDFTVYYVSWGQTGHLGLYEGCCPQTFLAGPDVRTADITVNGLKVKELKRADAAVISRELHITVPRPGTSYSFVVHAWYKSLSEDDAKAADQMLSTIAAK